MSEAKLPCPHCGMTLRLKDRQFVGKTICCPDCRGPIRIEADGFQGFSAEEGRTPAKTPQKKKPAPAQQADSEKPTFRESLGKTFSNPLTLAWLVAGIITIGVVMMVLPDGDEGTPKPEGDNPQPPIAKTDQKPAPKVITVRDRLTSLGRRFSKFETAHGYFPAGAFTQADFPVERRFSWAAQLMAESPDATWKPNRAWNSTANERFVRTPATFLMNPLIAEKTGGGYPTTHFVGVAGVGFEAATLPKTHGRAGIFGYNRTTKREDIQDGLANTMMIVGVTKDYGPWASVGRGTIRPFVTEPYVNGPDGFGTGQAESMMVLMADGSVREISKDVSPIIVRRMAAMNDGFPLDEEIPGEPGDKTAPPDRPIVNHPPPLPDRDPVLAMRPDPNKALPTPVRPASPSEIRRKLAQDIRSYTLVTPSAAGPVVKEIAEMIGVPLKIADIPPERLEKKITLTLQETTVGGILDAITRKVGLKYQIEPGRIILQVDAGKTP